MRTFITVSHTAPWDGTWSLDDLPGHGRIDLLCRNIQAALFTSHGIREDTRCILVFHGDPDHPRAVEIDGRSVRHLNPDERSTAARIQHALQVAKDTDDPWWEDAGPGIRVAPFDLATVLDDLGDAGHPHVLLHKDGHDLDEVQVPEGTYVLGDHQPLTDDEEATVAATQRVSLGDSWMHGNHVIAILQWKLDRA